jgi:hypothetical protein
MTAPSAVLPALFLLFSLALSSGQAGSGVLASAERKVQHVETNGALAHPSPAPTEFTEQEINAYLAAGRVELPPGVQSVSFQEQPGLVTGRARVDFERLKSGSSPGNPLLAVFRGVHEVVGVAHVHGAGGQGFVQVDAVSLDGVEIPRFALQLFVENYLQPKYPNVGLESRFPLPARIATVTVGLRRVTVSQR